jgi:hypothetical protein
MRVLTDLKDTVAKDALCGRLPIGARHSTISGLCAEQASAKKPWIPQEVYLPLACDIFLL